MDQEVQQPSGAEHKKPSAQALKPGYALDLQAEHEGKGNPALDEYPERDEQSEKRRNSEDCGLCGRHLRLGIGCHCLPHVAGWPLGLAPLSRQGYRARGAAIVCLHYKAETMQV
jgi:hypothetical protein